MSVTNDKIEATNHSEVAPALCGVVAIPDEGEFKKRFGFDAHLAMRKAVLEFKYQNDATDEEIKTLKESGNLNFSQSQAKINLLTPVQMMGLILHGSLLVLLIPFAHVLVKNIDKYGSSQQLVTMAIYFFLSLGLVAYCLKVLLHDVYKPFLIARSMKRRFEG